MGMEQSQQYCQHCSRQVLAARKTPNHVLHLLLTVITMGFWIPIWVLSSIQLGGWLCQSCGCKTNFLGPGQSIWTKKF